MVGNRREIRLELDRDLRAVVGEDLDWQAQSSVVQGADRRITSGCAEAAATPIAVHAAKANRTRSTPTGREIHTRCVLAPETHRGYGCFLGHA